MFVRADCWSWLLGGSGERPPLDRWFWCMRGVVVQTRVMLKALNLRNMPIPAYRGLGRQINYFFDLCKEASW